MDVFGKSGWDGWGCPAEQFRKRGEVTREDDVLGGVPSLVAPTPDLWLPEEVARPTLVETPILQSLGAQWAGPSAEALIWLTSLGVRRL